jgi:hypothetical protein
VPEVIACAFATGSCITGYDVTRSCITGSYITGNDVTGSRELEMKEIIGSLASIVGILYFLINKPEKVT